MIRRQNKKEKELKAYKKPKFTCLKGMRDVFFNEYRFWDMVTKKAFDIAIAYGFKAVKTPILEKTELYEKTIGKNSNIITKELYSFVDKGNEKIALRPEITPSLARVYVEHKMYLKSQPVKLFWLGPLFRYDKSESARFRQFHEFNLKIFGEVSPIADVQLILVAYNFFRELQINVEIQINTLGCKECQKTYFDELKIYYKNKRKKNKLCLDCKKYFSKKPLKILDCANKSCKESLEEAPQIVDSVCDVCRDHFVKILEYLDELGVAYNLNPFLFSGAEYQTRTVFEIWPVNNSLADNPNEDKKGAALGGGGRFDNLIEFMAGPPTPSCGIGINIERTIAKIKENNLFPKLDNDKIVFLAQLGDQAKRKAFGLFEELRKAGFSISQALTIDNLKMQLEEAAAQKAKIILIIGQKEVMDGTVLIKDIESGIQEAVDYKRIIKELEKRLAKKENK